MEAHADLATQSQRVLNQIKDQLNQSRRIIDSSALGQAYWNMLDLSDAPPPLSTTKLPLIEQNGSLSPESSGFVADSVGNALFFAEGTAPFFEDTTTTRIDIYRFRYYYLTQRTDIAFADKPGRLDLISWRSVYYADGGQLQSLSDTDRPIVVQALRASNIDHAWRASRPAGTAFLELTSGGDLDSVSSSYKIEQDGYSLAALESAGGRINGGMTFSVAYNSSPGDHNAVTVPDFASPSTNAEGFPHGFEIAVVGGSGGRQVFMRLVFTADPGALRRPISRANTILAEARDF
jgi:hypothetical protein